MSDKATGAWTLEKVLLNWLCLSRYFMLKMSLVSKVSVSNVLGQPVLGPFDVRQSHRSMDLREGVAELTVFVLVVLAVIPGKI